MEPLQKLCLYNQPNTYISFLTDTCIGNENLIPVSQFYVINPSFRPIPVGAILFCIKNVDNSTLDIDLIYDPFDLDQKCVRFIAWSDPTPHTTPLYISKFGNNTYISFNSKIPDGYTELEFSPIYVLTHPQSLFSLYQSRCIPDPNGVSLKDCMGQIKKDDIEPTLINYLNKNYKNDVNGTGLLILLGISILIVVIVILYTK